MGGIYVRVHSSWFFNSSFSYCYNQLVMYNRNKEKQIIADTILYGIVTLGIAWALLIIIGGIHLLIDKL